MVLVAIAPLSPLPLGWWDLAGRAESDVNPVTVTRARNAISVDGFLGEPDWAEVKPIGELLQREPRPGERATEPTEVKLLYDNQNLTSSLKWTTTFNTDFAETEVDARQINLTRFPLFFPEKRAFSLENAGVCSFSNTGTDIIPFFSRRLGRLSGREVPILCGTKLTGKAGRYDIGLLDVRTRETGVAPAKNFFVGRSLRAVYSVSPFLTFFNLVQFDNESKNLGWQSRVQWIIRPGNDVVFNQGWLQDERGGFKFRFADTRLAAKVKYTFRF